MNASDLRNLIEQWWDKGIGNPYSSGAFYQCANDLERLLFRFPFCDRGHPLPLEYWGKDCPICWDIQVRENDRLKSIAASGQAKE